MAMHQPSKTQDQIERLALTVATDFYRQRRQHENIEQGQRQRDDFMVCLAKGIDYPFLDDLRPPIEHEPHRASATTQQIESEATHTVDGPRESISPPPLVTIPKQSTKKSKKRSQGRVTKDKAYHNKQPRRALKYSRKDYDMFLGPEWNLG